jgi:hypothetical protein
MYCGAASLSHGCQKLFENEIDFFSKIASCTIESVGFFFEKILPLLAHVRCWPEFEFELDRSEKTCSNKKVRPSCPSMFYNTEPGSANSFSFS